MLHAVILICSLAAVPEARLCTRDTATQVITLPVEAASPVTCLMHGQAYVAETSIDIRVDEYMRVMCTR